MTYKKAYISGTTSYSETPQMKEVGDGQNVVVPWNLGEGGNVDGRKLGDILRSIVDDLTNIRATASGLVNANGGSTSSVDLTDLRTQVESK